MKIGFFSDSYKPYLSGVVKSIESFKSEMEVLDHEVYIFAPDYPEVQKQDNIYRFRSIPVPTNNEFRLAVPLSNSLLSEVKKLQLDIIHTHSPFLMGWLGKSVARKLDIPLVFTYHTLYEEYAHYAPLGKDIARWLAVKYSKEYCQSCDLVISPSDFVNRRLKSYGIPTPLLTIPTGIDLKPYRERKNKGGWIREKYNIGSNEKILLFVGRLGQEKNVSFLIRALRKIIDSLPDIRLIMVGDGPERNNLLNLANKLSLADRVVFTGKQEPDKVIEFYLAADLFVFPSVTETQGLVILEAMAGGLPVVAINAAGSTSMIDDGHNGLLVKEEEYLFARGVIELITHEMRYNMFKNNALKKAENYSIRNMALRLLDGYSSLVKNNKFQDIVTK